MITGMKLGIAITIIMFIIVILMFIGTLIINFNPKLKDKLFGGHTELAARRIKKGFMDTEKIYCKYCGEHIDNDSKFCKSCGQKQ